MGKSKRPWAWLALILAASTPTACAPNPAVSPLHASGGHACTEIVGPANLALSFDGGKTLVQSRASRDLRGQVLGLVSLGEPYALAAIINHRRPEERRPELFISRDGGCHWDSRGFLAARRLVEGRDGVAYAIGGGLFAVTKEGAHPLPLPEGSGMVLGVAIEPSQRRRVRLVMGEWEHVHVFDSVDRGESWTRLTDGIRTPRESPIHQAHFAYDPANIDRMLLTTDRSPHAEAFLTQDGGHTWALASGCETCVETTFGRGGTVWALGWGDGLFRSTDGGLSFAPVARPWPPTVQRLVGAQSNAERMFVRGPRELMEVDLRAPFAGNVEAVPLEKNTETEIETIDAVTLVPGATGVVSLGIDRAYVGHAPDPLQD